MKEDLNSDDYGMSGGYDNERWNLPLRAQKYDRTKDRSIFRRNFDDTNMGKSVNPANARRYRVVYKTPEVFAKEEADRKYKEGLKELYGESKNEHS